MRNVLTGLFIGKNFLHLEKKIDKLSFAVAQNFNFVVRKISLFATIKIKLEKDYIDFQSR
jgi:hypothetical protein